VCVDDDIAGSNSEAVVTAGSGVLGGHSAQSGGGGTSSSSAHSTSAPGKSNERLEISVQRRSIVADEASSGSTSSNSLSDGFRKIRFDVRDCNAVPSLIIRCCLKQELNFESSIVLGNGAFGVVYDLYDSLLVLIVLSTGMLQIGEVQEWR
jgi:hypothetical protein